MKQTVTLFLIGIIFFSVIGCDDEQKKGNIIISESETIAVVNNMKIPLSNFQKKFHFFLKRYKDIIQQKEQSLKEVKNIVINQLVKEELIKQEAARKGITITAQEMETLAAESFSPYQGAGFESILDDDEAEKEQWLEQLRYLIIEKKLVQNDLIEKIPVSSKEIKNYYQANKAEMKIPRAYRVRNITVATKDDADAIQLQLKRGAKLKDLVQNYSISPDRMVDGDLGFIERGELPPEMENAIFQLNFNKRYSDIILSQDGFHIFYLIQYRPTVRLTLKKASDMIKEKLVKQRQHTAYTQWYESLKNKATITIDQSLLMAEEGF
ncbi:MAG: peptidyl-prolyl cis-trans isomerase [Deltaproteobacteria bacterium]|nr:peptidyl-prolyl cis-trans isomerase [Deltaproteobacteria bacterium]